jgi:hypothetical protein
MASQTHNYVSPTMSQMSDVHSVQSTNPKDNQQSEGKRKSKNKKGKGDKKVVNNVGKGKN